MDQPQDGHDPVLLTETLHQLQLHPPVPSPSPRTFVDCTAGRGGHTLQIALRLSPNDLLISLDADERNLQFVKEKLNSLPNPHAPVRLFHANFASLPDVLQAASIPKVHAILADLGISTNQLFDPAYGLSFSTPMPLDMRLDPNQGPSAADIINKIPEEDLANVLYQLAQERCSRRIARKIVEARKLSPITTTDRLAQLVRSAVGHTNEKIDAATRTFMALRMKVNNEVENLQTLLQKAPTLLAPNGRLAIISFQSTEDAPVKKAFNILQQSNNFQVTTKKPITPTQQEIDRNPRSRSAKLRVLQRIA